MRHGKWLETALQRAARSQSSAASLLACARDTWTPIPIPSSPRCHCASNQLSPAHYYPGLSATRLNEPAGELGLSGQRPPYPAAPKRAPSAQVRSSHESWPITSQYTTRQASGLRTWLERASTAHPRTQTSFSMPGGESFLRCGHVPLPSHSVWCCTSIQVRTAPFKSGGHAVRSKEHARGI